MFSYRTGTVLCNDSCWHWRETHWRPKGSIKPCICAPILHLGMAVISRGRQPLSSNSASQNGEQVFSITASPCKDFDAWWSTSQLLLHAHPCVFSKACTQVMRDSKLLTKASVGYVCALGGGHSAKQGCPAVLTRPSFTNLGESQCTVIALGVRRLFFFSALN